MIIAIAFSVVFAGIASASITRKPKAPDPYDENTNPERLAGVRKPGSRGDDPSLE
jgi:hypothetical protein